MRSLVLASGSPRRRLLLAATGYVFDVEPADVDETPLPDEDPKAMVARLALDKARAAAARVDPAACVLAVDTTVVLDGRVLGKPSDDEHAVAMLTMLAGRSHDVVSGFVALVPALERTEHGIVVTTVTMRELTAAEIAAYVATGEPHDKAGAYAFQGHGRRLVSRVEGLKSNVVGLPLEPIVAALSALDVPRPRAVAGAGW
jgi:septum formation protein